MHAIVVKIICSKLFLFRIPVGARMPHPGIRQSHRHHLDMIVIYILISLSVPLPPNPSLGSFLQVDRTYRLAFKN